MQPSSILASAWVVLAASGAWSALTPAYAGTVCPNTPGGFVPLVQSSVASAGCRLDGKNWDMALHSGSGSNHPQPAPADFVQAELGSLSILSDVTFTVTHQTGVGFTYTMTNHGPGGECGAGR
jgi:hypothetical protein